MKCKCGLPMIWIRTVADDKHYVCDHCERQAIEKYNGTIWWWKVEAVENLEEATA